MSWVGGGAEAPWLAAWREWMGLATRGFKSAPATDFFQQRGATGFAQTYLEFAQTIQKLLRTNAQADFATRFVKALQAAAPYSVGYASGDEFLNAFLRAAPTALLAAFPAANSASAWQQGSATLRAWIEQLLALPAVGPQREWQVLLNDLQRAGLAEQATRESVEAHYLHATRAALKRFAATLQDSGGAPITSVRALYDAWIDQAEAAYAERVMTATFSRDFAAWIDAGSDLRLALRALGARVSALLDAPQRDEIDVLLQRQQDMQRELAALRAERREVHSAPREAPESGSAPVSPAVVSKAPPAPSPRKPSSGSAPAGKVAQTPAPKKARPTAGKVPKPKSTRGEFDIARILDGGK